MKTEDCKEENQQARPISQPLRNFVKFPISQSWEISQRCEISCIAKLVPAFVDFLVLFFLPIMPLCNSCSFCYFGYFVWVVWLEIPTQDFVKKGQLIFIGTRGKLLQEAPIFSLIFLAFSFIFLLSKQPLRVKT